MSNLGGRMFDVSNDDHNKISLLEGVAAFFNIMRNPSLFAEQMDILQKGLDSLDAKSAKLAEDKLAFDQDVAQKTADCEAKVAEMIASAQVRVDQMDADGQRVLEERTIQANQVLENANVNSNNMIQSCRVECDEMLGKTKNECDLMKQEAESDRAQAKKDKAEARELLVMANKTIDALKV